MPPVTVVIPVHNDAATLVACVRAVFAHTDHPDWKLVVVDDASTDGGPDALRAAFPDVQILRQPARGGVARALNTALARPEHAGRDFVRLHADVVVETSGWLQLLADAAYHHRDSSAAHAGPGAAVVGARLVLPDGRIQSEGRAIITGLGLHPQHRDRRAFSPEGAAGPVTEVDGVSGALAYHRRDLFDQIGRFDENYGVAWMDDDDHCIAARHRGHRVLVHPGVRGVHYTRALAPGFQAFVQGSGPELKQTQLLLKDAALRLQADYWSAKWGWDPFHPDLGEIRRLHGHTAICWQIGERLAYRPADECPSVDCCLVTWNTLPLLRRCLESLALTDYPADRVQVYIADNGSTDGTLDYLDALAATYPFRLHVIKLAVNTGAPIGFNFAVAAGSGELVARLDDDIVLPPDWLRPLVADLRLRPHAGCVGPKILNDNPARTIQCGPYRHFPAIFGHDDEPDQGQADYLARTTHVRGCCNLYRRDVFKRCGLFDPRFSPSQFDDPDHHLALLQAGYEVLYDGRVAVVHKLNNGLARSHAGISNQHGNAAKMFGKWGNDVFEVLERSLDLSREGRYLPDDGDTSAWLARAPAAASFPRRLPARPKQLGMVQRICDELGKASANPSLQAIREQLLTLATIKQRVGSPAQAPEILLCALGFEPTHLPIYRALAEVYQVLGQPALAAAIARRALHLAPDDEALRALVAPGADATASTAPNTAGAATNLARADLIGENAVGITAPQPGDAPLSTATSSAAPRSGLRVLMLNTFEPRLSGGDMHQVKKTRQYLQKLGVHVDVSCSPRPDPRGYDLIHVWNSWFPHQTLPQLKAVRAWAPDLPVVLSPIYWDMREKHWADTAVPALFAEATSLPQLNESLQHLAADKIARSGRTRATAAEPNYAGYELYQRHLFELVDHLLPQSRAELLNLKATLGVEKPFTLVANGAETSVFDRATPDDFVRRHGVRDFVLIVGLVEPRKNQLMLLHALRDSGLPVVVIGRHYDPGYYKLCRQFAPPGTLFIEHLPHEQLASAFKAARVHALPSWMECAAFANVEAALCGCALAVSDRTSEKEYFGDAAYYCDPANLVSIRNAVLSAHRNHAADAPKRARLVQQFRTRFTWENAARQTLAGYETALASARKATPVAA